MEKRKRPKITTGITEKIETGCGHLYVTPNWDSDFLIEIFSHLGKSGGCAYSHLEALTRSISLGLKYGIPLSEYIDELKNIRCPAPKLTAADGDVLSCADALSKVLIKIQGRSSNGHRIDSPNKLPE